jgi:hypothetical protein
VEIQGKARVKESFVPMGIFLVGILIFGLATGFLDKEYYRRVTDPQLPVVAASSRKLVDECGVFMFTDWHTPPDPSIDKEAPYVPMRLRVKQSRGKFIQ